MEENITSLFDVELNDDTSDLVRKRFSLNNHKFNEKYSFKELLCNRKKKHLTNLQKMVIYFFVFVVATSLAIYILLKDNFIETFSAFTNVMWWPVVIIIVFVMLSFLISGLTWTFLSKMYKKDYKYYQGLFNGMIGMYFANITPSSSGGQFAQAYIFKKQGLNVANSASILMMEFIVFQICNVIFSSICFIAGYNGLIGQIKAIDLFGITFSPLWLAGIGFTINALIIGLQFGLAYCKPLHRLIFNQGIDLLAKFHLISNPNRKRANLILQIATFRIELKRLLTNWKLMVFIVLFTCTNILLLNSINYFASLAAAGYSNPHPTYGQSLCLSGYLNLLAGIFFTPGNSGAAELGFYQIFISFFGNNNVICNVANIISRSMSFYLKTFLGAIVFLCYHSRATERYNFKLDSRTKVIYDLEIASIKNDSSTIKQISQYYNDNIHKKKKTKKDKILNTKDVMLSFEEINKNLQEYQPNINQDNQDKILNLTKQQLLDTYNEVLTLNGEIGDDIEMMKELENESKFFKHYRDKKIIREKQKQIKKKINKELKYIKKLNKLQNEPTELSYNNEKGIKIVDLSKQKDKKGEEK